MAETPPSAPLLRKTAWPPSGWSLRTKITTVLLVPVVVALTLAGLRINAALDKASTFSRVSDKLPVLRDVAVLTDLIDQEMIATVAGHVSAPATQVAAVNSKVADLQRAAGFTSLPPEITHTISTAADRFAVLRAPDAGTTQATTSAGYRDLLFALINAVPAVTRGTGDIDLDRLALNARDLLQLRTILAVQEALLRSIGPGSLDQSVITSASQAASTEGVLRNQIQSELTDSELARFNAATSSLTDRQAVLQTALATGRTAELTGLLPPIATEKAGLGEIVIGNATKLNNEITTETDTARSSALRDAALVIGALLAALAVALAMARSVLSPMRRLHSAALTAAHEQLPETIERVRGGEEVSWREVEPVGIKTGEEIGQLARAFDDMHQSAVRLAGEQAVLRRQVSEMLTTLARRSQSMVETQLTVLEGLESDEHDPQRLEELFRLDHLATRMRRNGENLQVLAGGVPNRQDSGPVSMVELMRGATSEVKDYQRVSLVNVPSGLVRSPAAPDIVHILAELLENATRFSPPEEKVFLTADRSTDGGMLVEVIDHGLGMTTEDLEAANHRLAAGDTVSPETTRRMGLFVVGRLAGTHGVTVRLRPTGRRAGSGGVTASVHLPGTLVIAEGPPAREPATVGSGVSDVNGLSRNGFSHNDTSGTPGTPGRRNGSPAADYTTPTEFVALTGLTGPPESPVRPGNFTPPAAQGELNGHSSGIDSANALKGRLDGGPSLPMRIPKDQQPPARTPIFERVVSNWFTEQEPAPDAESAPGSQNWVTASDEARRKAERAVQQPAAAVVSPAGLPTRKPGAQLAPGAALPRHPNTEPPRPGAFRDPAAVRNNLSRHYQGMRAARRQRSADEETS